MRETNYRHLWKRRKSKRTGKKDGPVVTVRQQSLPDVFVRALRETERKTSNANDDSPENREEFIASVGVGLKAFGKMQLFPLSSFDMYDADYLPSAGQTALNKVEITQAMRQKEKTMDELKSILGRISFTLTTLKEAEKELVVTTTPDTFNEADKLREARNMRRERIRKKIAKRRKRQLEKEQAEKKLKAAQQHQKSKKDTGGKSTKDGQNATALKETDERSTHRVADKDSVSVEGNAGKVTNINKSTDGQNETAIKETDERCAHRVADKDSVSVKGISGKVTNTDNNVQMAKEKGGEIGETATDKAEGEHVVEEEDDEWCSLDSEELDECDSSEFIDISSDDEDQSTAQQVKPKSSMDVLATRRRHMSESIARFLDRCVERDDLMSQMNTWMAATASTAVSPDHKMLQSSLFKSDHCIISPELLDDSKTMDIDINIEALRKLIAKLKVISDELGIGKTEEDEEQEEVQPEPPAPGKKQVVVLKQRRDTKIYNADELIIPDNLTAAIESLIKIFEEAIKTTAGRMQRQSLAVGLKQFKFICKIIEHRDNKINTLDKEIVKLGGDLTRNKKVVEDLRKNKKKMMAKCEKLESVVEDQKIRMEEQKKEVAALNKLVEDYKKKESYGLYDQSSFSSSSSNTSLSSQEEQKFTVNKSRKKKKEEKEKAKDKEETKLEKGQEKDVEKDEQVKDEKRKRGSESGKGLKAKMDDSKKTKDDPKKTKDDLKETKDEKRGEMKESNEQFRTEPLEKNQHKEVKLDQATIESTEIYQELKDQYDQTCKEVEIEREKLVEFEKEFENVKNEKVLLEQDKSDLLIDMENVKRKQEVETEELRDKIANFDLETKKLRSEIECNEEMIQYQEDRINHFSEEVQHLQEKLGQSLPGTPSMSSTSFAKRRVIPRKTSFAVEPPTARQMVAKIKQQYEAEIQGLKDYLAKENQRFSAETRRKEQEHKKDIQNIHKESLLVLRSINRFKDCASSLLDRENLGVEAYAMRKLPPLPLDETPGEVRQMLARMAILSNELLVSIELQLSKALMTKRLEVKDTYQHSRPLTDKRESDSHSEATSRRGRDSGAGLPGRAQRNAKLDDIEHEAEYAKFKLDEDVHPETIQEKYKELLNTYMTCRREGVIIRKVDKNEKELEEKLERKEFIIKKFMRKEKVLNRGLEDQRKVIISLTSAWRSRRFGQYYINKEDQLENLQLIKEALQKDRIPKGLYDMTINLIEEAIDLPRKRFIDLVQKYVRYVNLKELELRARKLKIEEDLGNSAMQFLQMLEKRIELQKEVWMRKKEAFIKKRAETLINLSKVLTRINEETNTLVTLPKILIKRAGETVEEDESMAIPDLYDTVKLLKEREKKKDLAADLKGSDSLMSTRGPSPPAGVSIEVGLGPSWNMMQPHMPTHASVTIPRLLDLDVNMTRLAAQQIVSSVVKGEYGQFSKSLPELKSLRPTKLAIIQRSLSQPPTKAGISIPTKRQLTLPPIATFYSSKNMKAAVNKEK